MLVDRLAFGHRRDAIARLGVLERVGDPALTGLTRIAAYVTGASAAAIHILDDTTLRRIAAENVELGDHPRDDSMCRLVVDEGERIVAVDASTDPRFSYSSFVQGPDPVRFYASVPLCTSDGVVVGTLCVFDTVSHELTERQVSMLEDLADQIVSQIELTRIALDLGHVASHDPQTGAVTRLVLTDRLAQAFARRLRYGGETLVVVVDIDDFSRINDHHGQDAGDEVLVEVAKRLTGATRAEDTVARTGGDEFVVLAELAGGPHVADDLITRIEEALAAPVLYAGEARPIEASIGGTLAEPGEDLRRVLRRADHAVAERQSASAAAGL
jgi:diguanylate cyclase (GGDEF)-like protein